MNLAQLPARQSRASQVPTSSMMLVLGFVLLAGCKSVSQYVSPRIEGRVLDAQSQKPIKDVLVARYNANEEYNLHNPPKGSQLMEQSTGVRTDGAGLFRLDSLRDVALFRHLKWYSVTLSFQRAAYRPLMATYTVADATNSVTAGEPFVRTGDILLVPSAE
jgi:vancomycin permeability regulator SanA